MNRYGFKLKLLAASCIAALAISCKEAPQTVETYNYNLMTVQRQNCAITERFSASVKGKQDVAIFPQVSGTITRLLVEEGSSVKRGETMFVIDQVPYQAAVAVAQANVQAAEAAVATAELTFKSKQVLFQKKVVSQFDLSTAENAYLTAKAQLAQAQAQLVNAKNNLSYTTVKSPADGVVGTLPFRAGALVGPSVPTPLTTVSDNSQMYVYYAITENSLLGLIREYGSKSKALEAMPQVELELNDKSIYEHTGNIASISGVIDKSTGTASVRAVFPNPDGLLHSGSSATVLKRYEHENVIVIPQSATFEIQDKVFVYKVIDGCAKSSPVKVVKVDGGQEYLVEEGLNDGDVIIAEGAGLVREGTRVAASQTEAAVESKSVEKE